MAAYKKLTFKQALIVLANSEEITTEPDGKYGPITFQMDENDTFILQNTEYMDLYDFAYRDWYVELGVYLKLFVESEVKNW